MWTVRCSGKEAPPGTGCRAILFAAMSMGEGPEELLLKVEALTQGVHVSRWD